MDLQLADSFSFSFSGAENIPQTKESSPVRRKVPNLSPVLFARDYEIEDPPAPPNTPTFVGLQTDVQSHQLQAEVQRCHQQKTEARSYHQQKTEVQSYQSESEPQSYKSRCRSTLVFRRGHNYDRLDDVYRIRNQTRLQYWCENILYPRLRVGDEVVCLPCLYPVLVCCVIVSSISIFGSLIR